MVMAEIHSNVDHSGLVILLRGLCEALAISTKMERQSRSEQHKQEQVECGILKLIKNIRAY
jgi:hypothetical protein